MKVEIKLFDKNGEKFSFKETRVIFLKDEKAVDEYVLGLRDRLGYKYEESEKHPIYDFMSEAGALEVSLEV